MEQKPNNEQLRQDLDDMKQRIEQLEQSVAVSLRSRQKKLSLITFLLTFILTLCGILFLVGIWNYLSGH